MIRPPKPADRQEATAIDRMSAMAAHNAQVMGAAAALEKRLWGIVYELPNGEQLMLHGGAATQEEARFHMGRWLRQNPEAKYDLNDVRQMDDREAEEIRDRHRRKYPRRRSLFDLTGGQPLLALEEPWRVPGSKIKPPRTVAATITHGWGTLGEW